MPHAEKRVAHSSTTRARGGAAAAIFLCTRTGGCVAYLVFLRRVAAEQIFRRNVRRNYWRPKFPQLSEDKRAQPLKSLSW
jgi:hypothetical protein